MKFNLIIFLIFIFLINESLEGKKGKGKGKGKKKPCRPRPNKPKRTTTTTTSTIVTTKSTSIIVTTTTPISTKCPENQTYHANMPTCTPKCPGLPKDLCSLDMLGPGCACTRPYATNATGHCILRTDCPIRSYPTSTTPPTKCKYPLLYVECRTACPETCNKKLKGDCLKFCLPSGCQCVPPYALTKNGTCVLEKECPKESSNLRKVVSKGVKCTGNFSEVSGRTSCEKICRSNVDYSKCMKITTGKDCECRYPYALNNKGQCIHENECWD